MKRTPLTKTVRFEVFKRDKFSCQYCGRSAPDVVLEVDHIVPVSEGGSNDIMNLVTACRDCNRGKTNRKLGDDAVIVKQKQQLEELQDRREQLEMMLKWREALNEQIEIEVNAIEQLIKSSLGMTRLTEIGRQITRKLIRRFGFNEVYQVVEYALDRYGKDFDLEKVGGICFKRKKAGEQECRGG